MELQRCSNIPKQQQRLFHNGKQLLSDTDYIACKGHPTPNVALSVAAAPHSSSTRRQHVPVADKSIPMRKFEECWILMLNCEACIQACENGITPDEREKINQPNGLVLEHLNRPCAADLGVLTQRLSGIYELHGKIMTDVGEQLQHTDNTGKITRNY